MGHVVVIGSGIAGLISALRAARSHDVTLVTKAELTAGSTAWAQGGIAAAVFADDSPELHTRDTLAAGAGLSDPDAVRVLTTEGAARLHDLVALGVEFDRERGGVAGSGTHSTSGGDDSRGWARGLEAAHSVARVLHAGGDATGRIIEHALATALDAARTSGRMLVREHTTAVAIVRGGDGRVCGVDLAPSIPNEGARAERLDADAVVIATGGNGQLYRHTTNPPVATGDGVVLGYAAGATVVDLEFVQFHPTVLPGGGLVSEAVRGEGAVLLDAAGSRFLVGPEQDPRAELAPRDVVARAIAATMRAQGGQPVMLDATRLGADTLRTRFPTIDRLVRAAGYDWTREPVPVTPAAHYAMGGLLTDMSGRTTVPGLFAVGETGSTGVHGANRLASNSLLEALVVGWRAGDLLAAELDVPALPAPRPRPAVSTTQDYRDDDVNEQPVPTYLDPTVPPTDAFADGPDAMTADHVRDRAWEALGLLRDGAELGELARELADARPADAAAARLLPLARLTAAAALARHESRGAHARTDYPLTDPASRWRRAFARPEPVCPELLTVDASGAARPSHELAAAAARREVSP
ncbi:L-aspartate oxidase [Microcella sp.]|uniref:L-aspartate oxidase n=1 Tax=Microcella sp. TaxID=1913979 RepID=UPI0039192AB7